MPLYNHVEGLPMRQFNGAGELLDTTIKCWAAIVTPTTGNGFNIDISSAGFSTIATVQAQIIKSTSAAISVPIVSVNSFTTTQVSLNIVQSSSQVLSILGVTVNGLVFATNFAGVSVHLLVLGY